LYRRRQFPKFFTYRARNDFTEDTIYRHLEPASAFQLELYRMRSYELEALPTSNQKMHLYLGKAKVSTHRINDDQMRNGRKYVYN
jgi:acetyl-CoA carboxylase / biotin carboxylase 1